MGADTLISTWFVADDADIGTFFPQAALRSDAPEAKAMYWRCTVCFFASSIARNPASRHAFFTNTAVPFVDGVDIAALFADWGEEVVTLPITYRLPKGAVGSFGNQFYIFDVLDYLAAHAPSRQAIVLDGDCLWIDRVETLSEEIERHGALTYLLYTQDRPAESPINGLSRVQMARFFHEHGGADRPWIPYFGGEIYAARQDWTERFSIQAKQLWPAILAGEPNAPREEAHFLSILYALNGIAEGTANPFIKRMWTTFRLNNLAPSDRELAIWHLPAEKRTGFAELFGQVVARPGLHPARDAQEMGLTFENYRKVMGWPRRGPRKLARDLGAKIAQKLR